jgi:hypothetical protein
MGMEKESVAIDNTGKRIDLYFFDDPMYHNDWHEAEKHGLVIIASPKETGNSWLFSKPEDKIRAKHWLKV